MGNEVLVPCATEVYSAVHSDSEVMYFARKMDGNGKYSTLPERQTLCSHSMEGIRPSIQDFRFLHLSWIECLQRPENSLNLHFKLPHSPFVFTEARE